MKVETDYRRANRERQKRYREEMKTRGYTMTSIYMNAETRLKLDSLCKSEGKTKAQIIERMISQYETPVSKDTVPPAREYNREEICKIIVSLRTAKNHGLLLMPLQTSSLIWDTGRSLERQKGSPIRQCQVTTDLKKKKCGKSGEEKNADGC